MSDNKGYWEDEVSPLTRNNTQYKGDCQMNDGEMIRVSHVTLEYSSNYSEGIIINALYKNGSVGIAVAPLYDNSILAEFCILGQIVRIDIPYPEILNINTLTEMEALKGINNANT